MNRAPKDTKITHAFATGIRVGIWFWIGEPLIGDDHVINYTHILVKN